ncbi:protein FAM98A-like [Centruroides sculpturatus]|uniref:protein FAM98A-like n=1 Tax=Centruroides sculpturatus TaxID=218467 RepID=UPI000C6D4812|nr:protein FAM98A-like [Centruroides sculpturatus]
MLEMDILDSLEDLGYKIKIDENALKEYVEKGPKCIEYTQLVEWLSKELQSLCNLEDSVNSILDPEDSSSFLLEASSFLKELNCPYKSLTEGPVNQRLDNEQQRLLLLDYLCTELQAARIISVQKNEKKTGMEIEIESNTASDLKTILDVFDVNLPIENVNNQELFDSLEIKVKECLSRINKDSLSISLLNDELTRDQWSKLQDLQEELHKEFYTRREMLLKRLDVTVQSCKWGERLKGKEDQIEKVFFPLRKPLCIEPSVHISDVLIAREDCTTIQKTSSTEVTKNAKNQVYKHMIGFVPDRGGRPEEQYAAREMPNWKKRTEGPAGDRGRGGRRGAWSAKGGKFGKNKRHAFDAAGSYGN